MSRVETRLGYFILLFLCTIGFLILFFAGKNYWYLRNLLPADETAQAVMYSLSMYMGLIFLIKITPYLLKKIDDYEKNLQKS
jgi:hypothetical protein